MTAGGRTTSATRCSTTQTKTNIDAFRDGLRMIREAAGPQTFILGCCAPQNMRSYAGVFGLVDAMRMGPDNGGNWKAWSRRRRITVLAQLSSQRPHLVERSRSHLCPRQHPVGAGALHRFVERHLGADDLAERLAARPCRRNASISSAAASPATASRRGPSTCSARPGRRAVAGHRHAAGPSAPRCDRPFNWCDKPRDHDRAGRPAWACRPPTNTSPTTSGAAPSSNRSGDALQSRARRGLRHPGGPPAAAAPVPDQHLAACLAGHPRGARRTSGTTQPRP